MAQRIVRSRGNAGRVSKFVLLAVIFILVGLLAVFYSLFAVKDMSAGQAQWAPSNNASSSSQSVPKTAAVKPKAAGKDQARHEKVVTYVPETVQADRSYFKDAIFIGDSISIGFRVNSIIPDKNVFAEKSVGLDKLVKGKAVYYTTGTTPKTLYQAINENFPNPGKIYILLGANGLPGYTNKVNIGFYYQLIGQLQKKYPKAIIYVESLTPVRKNSAYLKKFTVTKMNDFNRMMQKMAQDKKIYYLDVRSAVADKDGFLKAQYDAGDGMHMMSAGHKAMYQYYTRHVVQKDGYADVIVKGK